MSEDVAQEERFYFIKWHRCSYCKREDYAYHLLMETEVGVYKMCHQCMSNVFDEGQQYAYTPATRERMFKWLVRSDFIGEINGCVECQTPKIPFDPCHNHKMVSGYSWPCKHCGDASMEEEEFCKAHRLKEAMK